LLESAVSSIDAAFDGFEVYQTIEEKAARLAFGLVKNHAFIDGNKRIGILAMMLTLAANDIELDYTQQEVIDLGLSMANDLAGYDAVLQWIMDRKE